jgi:hypothetical protein
MRKLKCFYRSLKWKLNGVNFDGHTWTAFVSSETGKGIICVDCGRRKALTDDQLREQDWWNV